MHKKFAAALDKDTSMGRNTGVRHRIETMLTGLSELSQTLARHPVIVRARFALEQAWKMVDRQARKHKKVLAVALSVGLHVVLVLLLLMRPPAGMAGGGYAGEGAAPGHGVAVDLVDGAELSRMLLTVKPPAADNADEAITPLKLADADTALTLSPPQTTAPQFSDPSDTPPTLLTPQEAGQSGAPGDSGGTTGDDLWAAIAPCWNRLADGNTLPVTLEVSFGADGGIAAPPVIDADVAGQSDVQVQRSETIALQALAQCGAYAMAEGRQDVKVNFPRP